MTTEIEFKFGGRRKEVWRSIKDTLEKLPLRNEIQLKDMLIQVSTHAGTFKSKNQFDAVPALFQTIGRIDSALAERVFSSILPKVTEWARGYPLLFNDGPVPILLQGGPRVKENSSGGGGGAGGKGSSNTGADKNASDKSKTGVTGSGGAGAGGDKTGAGADGNKDGSGAGDVKKTKTGDGGGASPGGGDKGSKEKEGKDGGSDGKDGKDSDKKAKDAAAAKTNQTLDLNQRQCVYLLSAAFFCILPENSSSENPSSLDPHTSTLNFRKFFRSGAENIPTQAHKLCAILRYFDFHVSQLKPDFVQGEEEEDGAFKERQKEFRASVYEKWSRTIVRVERGNYPGKLHTIKFTATLSLTSFISLKQLSQDDDSSFEAKLLGLNKSKANTTTNLALGNSPKTNLNNTSKSNLNSTNQSLNSTINSTSQPTNAFIPNRWESRSTSLMHCNLNLTDEDLPLYPNETQDPIHEADLFSQGYTPVLRKVGDICSSRLGADTLGLGADYSEAFFCEHFQLMAFVPFIEKINLLSEYVIFSGVLRTCEMSGSGVTLRYVPASASSLTFGSGLIEVVSMCQSSHSGSTGNDPNSSNPNSSNQIQGSSGGSGGGPGNPKSSGPGTGKTVNKSPDSKHAGSTGGTGHGGGGNSPEHYGKNNENLTDNYQIEPSISGMLDAICVAVSIPDWDAQCFWKPKVQEVNLEDSDEGGLPIDSMITRCILRVLLLPITQFQSSSHSPSPLPSADTRPKPFYGTNRAYVMQLPPWFLPSTVVHCSNHGPSEESLFWLLLWWLVCCDSQKVPELRVNPIACGLKKNLIESLNPVLELLRKKNFTTRLLYNLLIAWRHSEKKRGLLDHIKATILYGN